MNPQIMVISLISFIVLGGAVRSSHENIQKYDQKANGNEAIAVIELFTSEGCSSCPPADRLLSETVKNAQVEGKLVYGLSFHVDYWNRLGWTDPYSQHEFSQRQEEYAEHLKTGRVYTPQMIVNGRHEFVGSDEDALNSNLKRTQPAQATITLTEVNIRDNELTANLNITGDTGNAIVNVALVESGLSNDVTNGENRGKTLSHSNVVRIFQQLKVSEKTIKINVPDKVQLANATLIVYLQQRDNWHIIGATSSPLK